MSGFRPQDRNHWIRKLALHVAKQQKFEEGGFFPLILLMSQVKECQFKVKKSTTNQLTVLKKSLSGRHTDGSIVNRKKQIDTQPIKKYTT